MNSDVPTVSIENFPTTQPIDIGPQQRAPVSTGFLTIDTNWNLGGYRISEQEHFGSFTSPVGSVFSDASFDLSSDVSDVLSAFSDDTTSPTTFMGHRRHRSSGSLLSPFGSPFDTFGLPESLSGLPSPVGSHSGSPAMGNELDMSALQISSEDVQSYPFGSPMANAPVYMTTARPISPSYSPYQDSQEQDDDQHRYELIPDLGSLSPYDPAGIVRYPQHLEMSFLQGGDQSAIPTNAGEQASTRSSIPELTINSPSIQVTGPTPMTKTVYDFVQELDSEFPSDLQNDSSMEEQQLSQGDFTSGSPSFTDYESSLSRLSLPIHALPQPGTSPTSSPLPSPHSSPRMGPMRDRSPSRQQKPYSDRNGNLAPPKSRNKTKAPAIYRCMEPGCGKTFTRPYNLKSHSRTHTLERPYVCELCDKTFARQHDRNRHTKLHSGVKPFICPHCNKAFARQDALNRHLRVENGPCAEAIREERVRSEQGRPFQMPSLGAPAPLSPQYAYPNVALDMDLGFGTLTGNPAGR